MNAYPARLAVAADGITVTFRDIPEAITGGSDRDEALRMARDALETAMEFYFEDSRSVPPPSPARRGEILIELPVSVIAKVLLLNAMIESKVRPSELARRLGTTRQAVNRLIDMDHSTKIDAIAEAMKAVGRKLEFTSTAV